MEDPRFKKIATDPRFKPIAQRKKTSEKVDPRFNLDKLDQKSKRQGKHSAKQRLPSPSSSDAESSAEEDEEVEEKLTKAHSKSSAQKAKASQKKRDSSDSSSENDDDAEDGEVVNGESESNDGEEVDESDDSDASSYEEAQEEEDTFVQLYANIPKLEEDSSLSNRLAIQNLDWENISARDLYILLHSFLPATPGASVTAVEIFLSDFGQSQMTREAKQGPSIDAKDEDETSKDIAIRKYELSKLRYYYAIATFDSGATANHIYTECDGLELEASANVLDIRVVPRGTKFSPTFIKERRKDVATSTCLATETMKKYKGLKYVTKALQSSKPELTWDRTDPKRTSAFVDTFNNKKVKKMSKKDEEEEDMKEYLKDYIASSSSEEDEDQADVKSGKKGASDKAQKYKQLLSSLNPNKSSGVADDDDDSTDEDESDVEGDKEMVVHDTTDMEKKIKIKQATKDETTWDAYLRKRKDKKKERKEERKAMREQSKEEEEEEQATGKKDKKSKKRDRQQESEDENEDEDRPVQLDDRFRSKMAADPAFAVDPTAPEFRKMRKTAREHALRK
jgi:hypothetical protein